VASSQTPEPGTWARTPRPGPAPAAAVLGRWSPTRAADVTAGRRQLGGALHDGARPAGAAEESVEGLLLAFEELVSNAVRHGRSPIEVVVTAIGHCWLLEVTDAAEDTPPIPDLERDAALGGLGLALVARLSVAHGWEPLGDGRKVVWARVDYTAESGRRLPGAPDGRASVPPDKPPIRVFLVDAHEVTRRGVEAALAADPQIRVVGEAESVEQAQRRVLAVRPDVAVVPGAQLCADLRSLLPGLRCLVFGQDVSPDEVHAAIRTGAAGYLVKDVRSAELVAAVRRVAAGQTLFDAATIALSGSNGHREDRLAQLTYRELQLLQLLGEGLSNREIAERLRLEVKTVKNYVSRLLAKLDLANRTQAAVLATQMRAGDGGRRARWTTAV
jgi:two-component system, NarL family, response regulator DevR